MYGLAMAWGLNRRAMLLWTVLVVPGVWAQAGGTIDEATAKQAFAQAAALSAKDGGRLWGTPLDGPMIFVAQNGEAVANQADAGGVLRAKDGVWVGTLPKSVGVANTATVWSGTRWTMVMWPLPAASLPRGRLLAHEMFHRIQDDLHLPATNALNPQLDTLEGRYWLQLEWRALAAALIGSGQGQAMAANDALTFRRRRQRLFPGSAETERALERNEGLAEYTGYALFAPDPASARWRIVDDLAQPQASTFMRSFAYLSGPAYGLLLDRRLPTWRAKLAPPLADFATLLAGTLKEHPEQNADARALVYGGAALRIVEEERAARTKTQRSAYQKLLVDGPVLILPNAGKFNYIFDPNNVVPLGERGTVYPAMEISDAWGTLKAEEGALLAPEAKSVTVAAPQSSEGAHITGKGWTLDLASGWVLVPGPSASSFRVEKAP